MRDRGKYFSLSEVESPLPLLQSQTTKRHYAFFFNNSITIESGDVNMRERIHKNNK